MFIDLIVVLVFIKEKYLDFKFSYVMLLEYNCGMFNIMGSGDIIFYDNYVYLMLINFWIGEIVVSKSLEIMLGIFIFLYIVDLLYYGNIGGLWIKVIWFIFGLILIGMLIMGFMMYVVKLVNNKFVKVC